MKRIYISYKALIILALCSFLFSNGCMDKKLDNPMDPVEQNLFVPMPVFNPPGGTYQANKYVSITCSMPDTQIYYSLDGSTPTQSSQPYHNPMWISLGSTLKARAFRTDYPSSPVATASYTYGVLMPTFNPPGGTYYDDVTVSIIPDSVGTIIRYTTNGSEPSASSTLYETPITISSATTLKARSYKEGVPPSSTATASYAFASVPEGFVLVEGGTFNNGSSNVTLSSFIIGKYEVTQAEYQAVMGDNPSSFAGNPNRPVEQVSWFKAIEYCNRRSVQEGLMPCYSYGSFGTNPANWPSGWNTSYANHTNVSCNWTANGYRLPTEMEWMFAAKGGNQSQGYTYGGSNSIGNVAWYYSNSSNRTWDVGLKAANELGTFDMSGNVWEWCWDIWNSSYPTGNLTNPTGPVSGSSRVFRGGSWGDFAADCTVSNRHAGYAASTGPTIGFRVIRVSR